MTVEDLLLLDRCQVVAGGVQPAVVVPVDPLQRGQLDVVEPLPGPAPADELGLEQPDVVSARALSSASPTVPTLGAAPAAANRSVNAMEAYCLASTGGCNTCLVARL